MADDVVISMENGWKRYGTTLTAEFKRLWHRPNPADEAGRWALRDLNFEVRRGEILGVIGRNGAGKSTLLKVLAGVSPLTRGRCELKGRMFPMIELNAGMHMDLSGRQNVHLLGAIMGFTPLEMERRLPEIEEFCELGEFFDRPVWTYSSGMLARLGFAVAVNVDAEVLLVDEILAVGDLPFQRKCFARMDALYRSGVSLVFVSHGLRIVEMLCHRTLYLEKGRVVSYGPTPEVITRYQLDSSAEELQKSNRRGENTKSVTSASPADHVIKIQEVELLNSAGKLVNRFNTGEPMTIRVHYISEVEARGFRIAIGIMQESLYVTGINNPADPERNVVRLGEGTFTCQVPRLMLLTGVYSISLKIGADDGQIFGGGANLVYFSVQTPEELRRSHGSGFVMTDAIWQL